MSDSNDKYLSTFNKIVFIFIIVFTFIFIVLLIVLVLIKGNPPFREILIPVQSSYSSSYSSY